MILAIDIGNSSIKFGVFANEKLIYDFHLESSLQIDAQNYYAKIADHLQKKSLNITNIIVCSVVNGLTEIIAKSLEKIAKKPIIIDKNSQIKLPIAISNNIKKEDVGKDRLITALAAFNKFGGNLAIDLGTATTIDIINQIGQYQGGVICAGINLTLKSLSQSTSLLPEIKPQKQKNIIGTNTIEAINSGIYFGHAAMIEAMVKKINLEYGQNLQIILTGGYAEILQELIPNAKAYQNLSLYGLLDLAYLFK